MYGCEQCFFSTIKPNLFDFPFMCTEVLSLPIVFSMPLSYFASDKKNNNIGLSVFTPISIAASECCQKHEHTVKITAAR